jgi:hypothetical protein
MFENLPATQAEHWRSVVIVELTITRLPREHNVNGLQNDMPSSGWNDPSSLDGSHAEQYAIDVCGIDVLPKRPAAHR